MAIEGPFPKRVILEYVGPGHERIYGFGALMEDGQVESDEDETFGSLPSPAGAVGVLKADGTLVSHGYYSAEFGSIDAPVVQKISYLPCAIE